VIAGDNQPLLAEAPSALRCRRWLRLRPFATSDTLSPRHRRRVTGSAAGNNAPTFEHEQASVITGHKPEPALVDAHERRRARADRCHHAQVVALKVGGSSPLGHPKSER
jgi:hypothetical protein